MYYAYRKRVTRIEVDTSTAKNAEEVLTTAKATPYSTDVAKEIVISDSFFIEDQADGKGIILVKEKVISPNLPDGLEPTIGKTFVDGG
jgi:hypothetical protein